MRTNLWDGDPEQVGAGLDSSYNDAMISLHEYSDALENGRVYDVAPFAALILAACKGKEVSAIPFPPVRSYVET